MGPLSWILLGLLAGWLAGLVTGRRRGGCITTSAIGILGAALLLLVFGAGTRNR